MSTAVAAAPAASPLPTSTVERQISPRQFATIAPSIIPSGPASAPPPSTAELPPLRRARSNGSPPDSARVIPPMAERPASDDKSSPASIRSGPPPMIKVKKEPGSPSLGAPRHRPKRLDLSSSMANSRGPQTARPLTSREAIQDVVIACLSPGFKTNDPSMREQLQRSLDVRDQQRQIIEKRNKGAKPGGSHDRGDGPRTQDNTLFGVPTDARTPTINRRKGPPPGLSINAPSASQFTEDRVVQSAPLHQTFTGLHPGEYPSRHAQHGPSALGQTSHIHPRPAPPTSSNRLPPIADVFKDTSYNETSSHSSHSNTALPPVPSPGYPPTHQQYASAPYSAQGREFRSAEEAVHGLSGGRDELLPKVVHYGGVVQPPTPPSPMPPMHQHQHQHAQPPPHSSSANAGASRPEAIRTTSLNSRRRNRDEYERDNGSPPSGGGHGYSQHHHQHHHHHEPKRTAYAIRGPSSGGDREEQQQQQHQQQQQQQHHSGSDWRTGMSGQEKREEFLRLCERAWDLFHS